MKIIKKNNFSSKEIINKVVEFVQDKQYNPNFFNCIIINCNEEIREEILKNWYLSMSFRQIESNKCTEFIFITFNDFTKKITAWEIENNRWVLKDKTSCLLINNKINLLFKANSYKELFELSHYENSKTEK